MSRLAFSLVTLSCALLTTSARVLRRHHHDAVEIPENDVSGVDDDAAHLDRAAKSTTVPR